MMERYDGDVLRWMRERPVELGRQCGFGDLREVPHGLWLREMLDGPGDITLLAHRGSYKTTCLSLAMAVILCTEPGKTLLFLRKTDRDVEEILDRQIQYNTAICEEGLLGDYGSNIGSVLLKTYGHDIKVRARAKAAAGSDARMNGCELPVVINSGSGNQGITASIPVIEYAKELSCGKEKLYRALVISNLTAIHQKTGIGTLSAFCGAVSAGAGAGAGIAYLIDGSLEAIDHTVVNALAIVSGIVCDGAKASCAAKIASSVDAGILGFQMYRNGQDFRSGDGIVMKGIENTIRNIARLGKEGMKETNEEIISMMVEN